MKLILQSNTTSLYLCKGDQWTPRYKDAYNFGSLHNLVEYTKKNDVADLQIVIINERSDGIDFVPFPVQLLLKTATFSSVAIPQPG
jgi:hypothetical protein